jgi:hypothetical protein
MTIAACKQSEREANLETKPARGFDRSQSKFSDSPLNFLRGPKQISGGNFCQVTHLLIKKRPNLLHGRHIPLDLALRREQTFNPFFLRKFRVKESKIARNALIVGLPPVRRAISVSLLNYGPVRRPLEFSNANSSRDHAILSSPRVDGSPTQSDGIASRERAEPKTASQTSQANQGGRAFIRVAHHDAIDKLFELTQNSGVSCPHGGRTSCHRKVFYLRFGGLERQRHSLPIVL